MKCTARFPHGHIQLGLSILPDPSPGFIAKTGGEGLFRAAGGFRRTEKPLQWAAMSPYGTSGQLHIGLVLGPQTLHHLGPVIRHLIVGLLDEPMQVTLIGPCQDMSELHLPSPPVRIVEYALPRLPFFFPRTVSGLAQGLRESPLTLLHALDTDGLEVAKALSAQLEVPYALWAFSLGGREVRTLDDRCSAVIAPSANIQEMLPALRLAPADRIHLVRPGVYQVRSATCFVASTHAAAIIAADPMTSPFGPSAALEAFAQLRQAGRECVFFLIGNGKAERTLRRQAEKLGLMDALTFVDETGPEQLTGIIKAADIFVSPTAGNRVDIELLAAMAGGVPVLAAQGSAGDFLIPDKTALVFRPGDSPAIAQMLQGLLDDHAAARELADAALAHLKENHSPARMIQKMADLYRQIAGVPTAV